MPSAKERLFGLEDDSYLAKRAHLTMIMHINHMIYVESRALNNPQMNTRIELLMFNLEKANRMAILQNGRSPFSFSDGAVAIATEQANPDD